MGKHRCLRGFWESGFWEGGLPLVRAKAAGGYTGSVPSIRRSVGKASPREPQRSRESSAELVSVRSLARAPRERRPTAGSFRYDAGKYDPRKKLRDPQSTSGIFSRGGSQESDPASFRWFEASGPDWQGGGRRGRWSGARRAVGARLGLERRSPRKAEMLGGSQAGEGGGAVEAHGAAVWVGVEAVGRLKGWRYGLLGGLGWLHGQRESASRGYAAGPD